MALWGLATSAGGAGPAGAGGPAATPATPVDITCNQPLLRSYLLKGRERSSPNDPFLLCPAITNSCCVRQDQQRIYHIVNDILPARLAEYGSKVRMALARLKTFHRRVTAAAPVMLGSARRRRFCQRQARNVLNFPFHAMYQNLVDQLTALDEEMAAHYRSFFCVLCDAGNHPFLELTGAVKKIVFDTNYCRDFLGSKASVLRSLNVELLDYLVALQNLVDCTHYVRSYDLPFFAPEKVAAKAEVAQCLNFLGAKNFARHCRPICERLTLSKVITVVQGDFEFLIDAANLFEKFYDFKETGNFVSAKLRRFFARFAAGPARKAVQTAPKAPAAAAAVPAKRAKAGKKVKAAGRSLVSLWARGRKLVDEGVADRPSPPLGAPASPIESTAAQSAGPAEAAAAPAHAPTPGLPERLLAAATKAKLAVDPNLSSTYGLIPVPAREDAPTIFRVQGQPVDFEAPLKTWSVGNGINPARYEQSQFDMPAPRFYRLLYNFQRREPVDVSLEFFLADFTPEAFEDSLLEIKTDFKMDPKQFALDAAAADPKKPLRA